MDKSDWLSLIAIVISSITAIGAFVFGCIQYKLNKILISEKEGEINLKNKPWITANTIPLQNGVWIIRVLNIGGKKAKNIDFKFDKDPQWNEMNKFPVNTLSPGKHVDMRISPDNGSLSDRAVCIFTWKNEFDKQFNDEIELII